MADVLAKRNGFYAYESALLLRPFDSESDPLGIMQWNNPKCWKSHYDGFELGLFFAEDVFGGQFCLKDDKVWLFDPETAQIEMIAESLDEWAFIIMDDFQFRTGHPIAHAWQEVYGVLEPGIRLLPKLPFVLGGSTRLKIFTPAETWKGCVGEHQLRSRYPIFRMVRRS